MKLTQPTALSKTLKIQLLNLWNNEYLEKLTYPTLQAFEKYLDNLISPFRIFLYDENQQVQGWYFDFTRDEQRWFVVIIDSNLHGQGYGTKLLNLAKVIETELNGWLIDHHNDKKQNGEIYPSPLPLYLKGSFELLS